MYCWFLTNINNLTYNASVCRWEEHWDGHGNSSRQQWCVVPLQRGCIQRRQTKRLHQRTPLTPPSQTHSLQSGGYQVTHVPPWECVAVLCVLIITIHFFNGCVKFKTVFIFDWRPIKTARLITMLSGSSVTKLQESYSQCCALTHTTKRSATRQHKLNAFMGDQINR